MLLMEWHAGRNQRYKFSSNSSMNMQEGIAGPSSIVVSMQGLLDTLTLESGPSEAIVGMQLASVELKINGVEDRETNRVLDTPFRVLFNADGMPLEFEFPATVDAHNRKILESLVRTFQVSLNKSDSWQTRETNGLGSYEASYRRSGANRIEKSKLKYTIVPDGMVRWNHINSTESLQLDAKHDWLARMEVVETMRSDGGGSPAMTVTNHARLELQPGAHTALSAETWSFAAAAASEPATNSRPAADIDVTKAREQIQSTILQLDPQQQGRLALIHRLRDLLRVDDQLALLILETLKTQELSDRTRADLYLALELAGTDGAQAALASVILDTSWSLKDGMRAIVAMAGVDFPIAASFSALWDATQRFAADAERQRMAGAAAFALGSLGNTLNQSEDPAYISLRAELLANALNGSDAQQRANFITALGNTQDPSLAPELAVLLDDADPAIRRATALSLGSLGTDPVADQLVSLYGQEDDRYVRSAIAESLQSWGQPSEPAMAMFRQTVLNESDERTRYNIALLLSGNLETFPENEVVLREIMRSEPSKRIRQKVAEALSGMR
jgi:hypothetical protein